MNGGCDMLTEGTHAARLSARRLPPRADRTRFDVAFASRDTPPKRCGSTSSRRRGRRCISRSICSAFSIPTQEEAQEIEVSARLYHEDSAEFMTMTGVSQLESEAPMTTPISFILKGETLATIRYAQPKPFFTYATRAQKTGAVPCINGEQVMLGLVEALIERMAQALEKTGRNLERLSRQVFRYKSARRHCEQEPRFSGHHRGNRRPRRSAGDGPRKSCQPEQAAGLSQYDWKGGRRPQQGRGRLGEGHAAGRRRAQRSRDLPSNKTNFLLDASLGLINLEQNQIIKIFSIAAVCLMPPTLIASSYGMNFRHMPELEWLFGYPYALALMLITAIIPFVWFKRKGWL